ncbi:MAG: histidine kinase dimerization/phospho-acceptor domain-containing protein [Fusobacteriaceae bacterium]
MKKYKFNFKKKLLLYSTVIIILAMLLSNIFSSIFLDKFYLNRKKNEIPKIMNKIKSLDENSFELEDYFEVLREEEGVIVRLKKNRRTRSHMGRIIDYSEEENKIIIKEDKGKRRFISYRENLKTGTQVHIFSYLSSTNNIRHEIHLINILSSLLALLLCTLVGSLFLKKITKNVEKLNIAAKKISNLEFNDIIEINTEDEIGELSHSIVLMSNNLKDSINKLKNFVSNASHEMKTPIAIINMTAQNLKNDKLNTLNDKNNSYDTLIKETKELTNLIENLLTLSKIDSFNKRIKKEKINITELIKKSLLNFELLELENDVSVTVEMTDIYLVTNKNLIKLVFNNLIQNALKYSPYKGDFKIYRIKNEVYFENNINYKISGDILKLTEPFVRGSNTELKKIEGSGLGLSIVKNSLQILEIDYEIKTTDDKFIFILKFHMEEDNEKNKCCEGVRSSKVTF